jgi:hypothetical protein
MTDEEFLRYLPRCDKCGEVFPVSSGPMDFIGLKVLEDHQGERTVVEDNMYHVECAPKKPDGSSYPAGCVIHITRDQP